MRGPEGAVPATRQDAALSGIAEGCGSTCKASLSYVCPSAATTGSWNTSCVIGQMAEGSSIARVRTTKGGEAPANATH